MFYHSDTYLLQSTRHGVFKDNQMFGKTTIFFTVGLVDKDCNEKLKKYIKLNGPKYCCIALPYSEHSPGRLIEYENILGKEFMISDTVDHFHSFFEDFGLPFTPYTEYHFNSKLQFTGKHSYA
tara:strand:+ start:3695 stop:4063 length:369 start_codon:yes stop_codon:yes gene_type:complete